MKKRPTASAPAPRLLVPACAPAGTRPSCVRTAPNSERLNSSFTPSPLRQTMPLISCTAMDGWMIEEQGGGHAAVLQSGRCKAFGADQPTTMCAIPPLTCTTMQGSSPRLYGSAATTAAQKSSSLNSLPAAPPEAATKSAPARSRLSRPRKKSTCGTQRVCGAQRELSRGGMQGGVQRSVHSRQCSAARHDAAQHPP